MLEEATKVKRLPRNNLRTDFSRLLLNDMDIPRLAHFVPYCNHRLYTELLVLCRRRRLV